MKYLFFCSGLLLGFLAPSGQAETSSEQGISPQPDSPEKLETSDYIRFTEGKERDTLQTAVTRFRRDGYVVDLVGVVHLADSKYFESLNRLLATYDRVLYEMVGGAYTPEAAEAVPSGDDEMAGIRQLQTMAKSILGLEFQLDGIDYTVENFVHADVDSEGLDDLMEARNQNFSEIFSRAMTLSQEGGIAGLPSSEAGMNQMFSSLLSAVTTGNSNELKRLLAPFLSEAEAFIAQLEGEDGTVLVTERNKVVMTKLAEEQEKYGPGSYAIFYGAGHMPDLEERLLALGYSISETSWSDAWVMAHPGEETSEAATAIEPGDFFLNLLQDNPEMMEGLQKMGEMLEQLPVPE